MPNKLHDAAADKRKGHVTVKELIEINLTDPNEKHTESGRTPITFAAQSGSALTVKYLAKDAQASLDAQQQDKNLMHYAIENSADVLLYTATLHDKFNDGTTELHAAAATGDQLQVEAILAKSPKRINEKNRRGESALYWAAYAGQLSTLAFIRQHDAYRLISEAEYNEDLRTVAEIFHVEATKQHNEAMRNTSGNHLEVAIANYQRAILYRNDIKKKNDSDLKSLSNYYTNLGDA
jgi:ankyrin repeat protein